MPDRKEASSQVAWALLTEGVSKSRVEAHRLQQLLVRANKLIDASPKKDHIHQVAGDLIRDVPARLEKLVRALDKTSYALSQTGQEFLKNRIPQADRLEVDDAVESTPLPKTPTAARVAARHLRSSDD